MTFEDTMFSVEQQVTWPICPLLLNHLGNRSLPRRAVYCRQCREQAIALKVRLLSIQFTSEAFGNRSEDERNGGDITSFPRTSRILPPMSRAGHSTQSSTSFDPVHI